MEIRNKMQCVKTVVKFKLVSDMNIFEKEGADGNRW